MTAKSKGAVAAGHPLTARAAADVLADGGTAVDAALAGLWMACLAEPVLASPGGGGFLMAHDGASGETTLFDFFTQTPRKKRDPDSLEFESVHADFGTAKQEFHIGHGASATPGFVPGLYGVHGDLGTIPMSAILQPAAAAARAGIEITAFQAYLSAVVAPILTANDSASGLYAPDGALLREGASFANPALAGFLDGLAQDGMAFYENEVVPRFCAVQQGQGHLSAADFAAYEVHRRPPLALQLCDAEISLNPPPSAGGAFIAYALRHLNAQDGVPGARLADALASADDARIRYQGNVARMLLEVAFGDGGDIGVDIGGGPANRGTTHISVIDGAGNAASATISNGSGNGQVVPDCGFMLNNMLGEADLNRGGFHKWRENSRLSSNMCPSLSLAPDGTLIALGSGGSNRIRSAVFQVLVRMVRDGMAPEDAVHAPRVHVEVGHLDFEDDIDAAARDALVAHFPDHRAWPERNLFYGGVHTVCRAADGSFEAIGDARRAGTAVVV